MPKINFFISSLLALTLKMVAFFWRLKYLTPFLGKSSNYFDIFFDTLSVPGCEAVKMN